MFSPQASSGQTSTKQPRRPVTRRIRWEHAPYGHQIVVRDAMTEEVIAVVDSLFDISALLDQDDTLPDSGRA